MRRTPKTLGLVLTALLCGSAQAQPYAYISNIADNTVSVIDVATHTVIATVPVGGYSVAAALTADDRYAFVPSYYDNDIAVIDTTSNTVITTVPNVGSGSVALAFNPAGTRAYVANFVADTVSILDEVTAAPAYNTVIATIPVGQYPDGVAVSPDGNRVYVANNHGNSVSVINTKPDDTNYNTVIATIPVGLNPAGLAVSPDGSKVYAPSSGGQPVGTVVVIAVDASNTPSAITSLITMQSAPTVATFSPDGRCAYVGNQSSATLSVIDVASASVAGTIDVGAGPIGVDITHDGRFVHVVNNRVGTVSVVDAATARVINTIMVGTKPSSVGKFITPQDTDSLFVNDFGVCGF